MDGQLLAVAKASGGIYVYLTKLSMLASVWQQKIAFMTSLCEVSIYDHQTKTKVKREGKKRGSHCFLAKPSHRPFSIVLYSCIWSSLSTEFWTATDIFLIALKTVILDIGLIPFHRTKKYLRSCSIN